MSDFSRSTSESAIRYPLTLPQGALKRTLKLALGRLLVLLLPKRSQKVLTEGDPMAFGALDQLLLAGQLGRMRQSQNWDSLIGIQQRFWAGQGGKLFSQVQDVADRFHSWFLGPHQAAIDALATEIGDGSQWQQLVELGSGNGLALDFVSHRFPALPKLVGVDLNASVVQANTQRYQNPRLHFVTAEVSAWVQQHAQASTVWLSNAGVLEYLHETQVRQIYQHIAQQARPAVFTVIEPIALGHDLKHEASSRINYGEHSFSHNHSALLVACGWTLRYQQEVHLAGGRWLMLVACTT